MDNIAVLLVSAWHLCTRDGIVTSSMHYICRGLSGCFVEDHTVSSYPLDYPQGYSCVRMAALLFFLTSGGCRDKLILLHGVDDMLALPTHFGCRAWHTVMVTE